MAKAADVILQKARRTFNRVFLPIVFTFIFLLPGVSRADRFYITQGLGCESWVVFLSSRNDQIYPEYDAYGSDGITPDERLRVWARPRDITYFPAA